MPLDDASMKRTEALTALGDAMRENPESIGSLVNGADVELLAAYEMDFLSECLQVVRKYHGDSTPAEAFLIHCVHRYSHKKGAFTPEDAQDELEDFRQNFHDAIEIARRVLKLHPELAAGEAPQNEKAPSVDKTGGAQNSQKPLQRASSEVYNNRQTPRPEARA